MLLFTGKSKMGSSQLVAVAVYGGMFKVQFFHLKASLRYSYSTLFNPSQLPLSLAQIIVLYCFHITRKDADFPEEFISFKLNIITFQIVSFNQYKEQIAQEFTIRIASHYPELLITLILIICNLSNGIYQDVLTASKRPNSISKPATD